MRDFVNLSGEKMKLTPMKSLLGAVSVSLTGISDLLLFLSYSGEIIPVLLYLPFKLPDAFFIKGV